MTVLLRRICPRTLRLIAFRRSPCDSDVMRNEQETGWEGQLGAGVRTEMERKASVPDADAIAAVRREGEERKYAGVVDAIRKSGNEKLAGFLSGLPAEAQKEIDDAMTVAGEDFPRLLWIPSADEASVVESLGAFDPASHADAAAKRTAGRFVAGKVDPASCE